MKRFVQHLFLFSLPFVLLIVCIEISLRNIPNDYSYKNEYLEKNAQNIQTLFLGSSHTFYGINPQYISGNAFNASHVSQSIDWDYELLKKYSSNFKSLQFISIPIDYSSLLLQTSSSVEKWRVKNYNIYYNLKLSLNPRFYFEIFSFSLEDNIKRIRLYYLEKKSGITCTKLGYGIVEGNQEDLIKTGKSAALRHTIKDQRHFNENINVINKIVQYGEEKNINILFYTSPAYQSYRKNLDSNQYYTTINTIESIANKHKNAYYYNLIADSNFVAEDFMDADHLNKSGAKKLTKTINDLIDKIKYESATVRKGN